MPHSLQMLHTHHRTSAGILLLGTGYLQSLEEVQIHKFRSIIVTRLITDLQREITLPSLHVCQYKNIQGYIYIAVYFSVRLSECQELGLWKASS